MGDCPALALSTPLHLGVFDHVLPHRVFTEMQDRLSAGGVASTIGGSCTAIASRIASAVTSAGSSSTILLVPIESS